MSPCEDELHEPELILLLDALADFGARLPPGLRSHVLGRVSASEQRDANPAVRTVRAHEGSWRECVPGIHVKILYDDGVTHTCLARLDKGVHVPAHAHELDEECLVIEGALVLDGVVLHAGDFQIARAGTRHEDAFSPTGCLVLVRSASTSARAAV